MHKVQFWFKHLSKIQIDFSFWHRHRFFFLLSFERSCVRKKSSVCLLKVLVAVRRKRAIWIENSTQMVKMSGRPTSTIRIHLIQSHRINFVSDLHSFVDSHFQLDSRVTKFYSHTQYLSPKKSTMKVQTKTSSKMNDMWNKETMAITMAAAKGWKWNNTNKS